MTLARWSGSRSRTPGRNTRSAKPPLAVTRTVTSPSCEVADPPTSRSAWSALFALAAASFSFSSYCANHFSGSMPRYSQLSFVDHLHPCQNLRGTGQPTVVLRRRIFKGNHRNLPAREPLDTCVRHQAREARVAGAEPGRQTLR